MFGASVVFFVIGLLAILFSALGLAGMSLDIGRTLLVTFFALAVVSFLAGVVGGKTPPASPRNE